MTEVRYMDVYLVNGVEMIITEEQAERFDRQGKDVEWLKSVKVTSDNIERPLPDEAANDYIDCTCKSPDDLCPACEAQIRSMYDDDEIPFMF